MIEKSFLDAIPSILEYKLYGLITVILLINLILLIYVINKENMKTGVIKIIKLFMFVSLAMLISFFMFMFFNKPTPPTLPVAKEWSIKGNIELQDRNGTVLHKISKDSCGKRLSESIPLAEFLSKKLETIILPNLISKSFGSSHFTVNIPENLGKDNLDVLFRVDGFRCSSKNTKNCIRELNSSNYNLNLKTMIFIQNEPDKEECASQSTVGIH